MVSARRADHIGEHIEVEVTNMLQTNAGRMVFADIQVTSDSDCRHPTSGLRRRRRPLG